MADAQVPTRTLGNGGLIVSMQGLGCMGMSQSYGPADADESIATIHRALELGTLIVANLTATLLRFVLLRRWVFARAA